MGVKKQMDTFFASLGEQTGYNGRLVNTPMGPFRWNDVMELWENVNNGMVLNNISFMDEFAMMDYSATDGGSDNLGILPLNLLFDFDFMSITNFNQLGEYSSRLNFSRTSNATYTNEFGNVAWADANMIADTSITRVIIPSSSAGQYEWAHNTVTGATFYVLNGDMYFNTFATGGNFSRINVVQQPSILGGYTYTASAYVVNTGTAPCGPNNIIWASGTTPSSANTSEIWYWNGVPVSSSTPLPANTGGTLAMSMAVGTAATRLQVRYGHGTISSSVNANTVILRNPQLQIDDVPSPVFVSNTGSSPYHAPRFEYFTGVSAGTKRGLYIEGAATNVLFNSETFPTSGSFAWTHENVTLSFEGITAPTGLIRSVAKFLDGFTNTFHRISQSQVWPAGEDTISIWVKQINGISFPRRFTINANTGLSASATYDLTGVGSVVSQSGSATNRKANIEQYNNGWYRCHLTGTCAAAASIFFQISGATETNSLGGAFLGDTLGGLYLWGAQLTNSDSWFSYIPSTTTQGTRSKDNIVIDLLGTTGQNYFGSIYHDYDRVRRNPNRFPGIGYVNSTPTFATLAMPNFRYGDGATTVGINVFYNNNFEVSTFGRSVPANSAVENIKSAYAWGFGPTFGGLNMAGATPGSPVGTTFGYGNTSFLQASLTGNSFAAYRYFTINTTWYSNDDYRYVLKRLKYWNQALSVDELKNSIENP